MRALGLAALIALRFSVGSVAVAALSSLPKGSMAEVLQDKDLVGGDEAQTISKAKPVTETAVVSKPVADGDDVRRLICFLCDDKTEDKFEVGANKTWRARQFHPWCFNALRAHNRLWKDQE